MTLLHPLPVGEDTVTPDATRMASVSVDGPTLYEQATNQALDGARRDDIEGQDEDFDEIPTGADLLAMVREGEAQASMYMNQVNQRSWTRAYRAYNNRHFVESKYETGDFKHRSRLFVPATRRAVRKDLAAVAASLFGSLDAVTVLPGNEADENQRASAAVIQELVNYRTDRASRKASIPWFHVAMGSRMTSVLAGFIVSKQSWKLELRRTGSETVKDDETGEEKERDVWEPDIDRPDCEIFPPENVIIDPAADWTNPIQDAAYAFLKFPMRLDEIRKKQRDPRNPWKPLHESVLRGGGDGKSRFDMEAIRRARENGIDRMNDTEQGNKEFDVIWIYECFIRTAGEDWTFLSVGDQALLTDPKPVREVYPEQFGERPLVFGYGALEPFRIFPMSAVESWQPLQEEMNDLRNLTLDTVKQNVTPVTKVVRGRQVDLEQLKRRSHGTAIMVQRQDDVTWDRPPDLPQSTVMMKQYLDVDFDDLAGQANYGSVQNNNALGRTLGGLQLAAGAANAVQEFDIRVWIESWCEPVLAQIVHLEQFYESDPTVLALAGERAQLMPRFGISEISNDLLEREVTLRVNIGLGAGDPQQRLAKFNSALQVVMPVFQASPDFAQGKVKVNVEAVAEEVFGAAGYRDGGKRFLEDGDPNPPQPNPMLQPQMNRLAAQTTKDQALAKKAIIDSLSNAAKVGISIKEEERRQILDMFDMHHRHVDQVGKAVEMGHKHGASIAERKLSALNANQSPLGPGQDDSFTGAVQDQLGGGTEPDATSGAPAPAPMTPGPLTQPPRRRRLTHHRGPDGRITHTDVEDLPA